MTSKSFMKKITVIGNGGWGTTLAILLHKKGYAVTLWGADASYVNCLLEKKENVKFLKGIPIPEGISITSDISNKLMDAELIISATPTPYLRSVLTKFKGIFVHGIPIVSVTKGIENDTLMRPSAIITNVLGDHPISLLLGPSHAQEVARGLPTTVVASSIDGNLARLVQEVFSTERFRVYTNPDMVGVELGAAMKNVIAIAAGICDGLKFGDNSKAALISRGLVEISRLGIAMGSQRSTFSGLTGLGDLITTCISPYGRNRWVGEQIGKGKKLQEILEKMEQIAEGVWTTKSVLALSHKFKVEMPITKEIYNVLFTDKNPLEAVSNLMMRAPKSEIEELI
ncbi:MAG: NAD(P)-dependent glycerol-3-phosphate dehydrogenase [Candidatus Brocadia sp. AMX2]|uniref:Glycerol-3-phosphate dehydrogenase [NAD(P)+] n=2 Tax=Candidatus Brocadiaceae TaxID=1127830 RepID=A0ABQ0JUH9_9BACT|nr:MAG: NAD(P)-dependent glycerol-3-phosphate dehydrogenase [Candidatus Brocadia sp. AMX2]MBC6932942.1 NAD(P)-dependent glycerol-3-phosphate dehydrogenase [Candidatus Brocadia sp.]MBL1169248.1 NAD(P)-dependent glycerol-3-phosphate dehydrogenase [Candidatus Brocadia sp. AMX1]NOG41748.1 NAD(P)-dependent glycerol-3-phosphate dehydrogenase [Planctomycetota bacterium]NUO05703.1 NAD(P)-dependent glycerol-3-phosphate dehydrogenase [Candidatus Brocadia sinica]GAN32365.1 NAD(P)H glycerol 3 phosphate de